MPNTKNLSLQIDFQNVDMGPIDQAGIKIDYVLEEPENWQDTLSSGTQGFTIPCSKRNDKIFNTYHNSDVIDTTNGMVFRQLRDASLVVNGRLLLMGKVALENATYTDKPGDYTLSMVGGNGDWIQDMQNLTLWDCLSSVSHAFTVANVQKSWQAASAGGYDSDEDHDYVYYPVRYRQPFDGTSFGHGTDDTVNIYMLRPALSIYWMIIRAFRQFGYSVSSDFLNSQYFRRLTMSWTWGDFYDINSQLVQGLCFKAAGVLPADIPSSHPSILPGAPMLYTGDPAHPFLSSSWGGTPTLPTTFTGTVYVFSTPLFGKFDMSNGLPPNGFNNFGLYSFDHATGTMSYTFNPPPGLSPYVTAATSLSFSLSLYLGMQAPSGSQVDCQLEISINGTIISSNTILPGGGPIVGSSGPYPAAPSYFPISTTNYDFVVPNVNLGDVVSFRLKLVQSGPGAVSVKVATSGYINVNPGATGANSWQYDSTINQWQNVDAHVTDYIWQPVYSTLTMTGLLIELGNNVNFRYYDAFRGKNFLDMFGGLVDDFDLEIQTNPITKTVTIEPFSGVTLPDYDAFGDYIGDIDLPGYFDMSKVVDWTDKQDLSKVNTNELFSNSTRQIDFNMKQDGSDGGQNIFAARNQGIYLNNVIKPKINNTILDNGIIAGVPGASRYMLPNRFQKGNTQKQNRFFSSVMHYKASPWDNITGLGSPAPQLVTIFPQSINDSSSSAVTQIFDPKIVFWAGLKDPAGYGGWRWVGDPNAGGLNIPTYTDDGSPSATGFQLPYAFAVNYNSKSGLVVGGNVDPVMTYSDQLVYDNTGTPVVVPGLMRKFFLRRMAIMNNGDLKHAMMRLNLSDITNFEHREVIKIGNGFYGLIAINGYDPLSDDSCECILWKLVSPVQSDLDNCYPSQNEVLTQPLTTAQYDLKYAQQLLFPTDIPQVG